MENSKLIPEGEYTVLLSSHAEGRNKKGTGDRINLVFDIKTKQFADKKLYLDLNANMIDKSDPTGKKVLGPNEGAEAITTKILNSFLKATGKADKGLEDIDYDRTKLMDFNCDFVTAVVIQKEQSPYVNKDGVQVAARLKNEILYFKQR